MRDTHRAERWARKLSRRRPGIADASLRLSKRRAAVSVNARTSRRWHQLSAGGVLDTRHRGAEWVRAAVMTVARFVAWRKQRAHMGEATYKEIGE